MEAFYERATRIRYFFALVPCLSVSAQPKLVPIEDPATGPSTLDSYSFLGARVSGSTGIFPSNLHGPSIYPPKESELFSLSKSKKPQKKGGFSSSTSKIVRVSWSKKVFHAVSINACVIKFLL